MEKLSEVELYRPLYSAGRMHDERLVIPDYVLCAQSRDLFLTSCNFRGSCKARKRGCKWVYLINEIKQDPGDTLCVCEVSLSLKLSGSLSRSTDKPGRSGEALKLIWG